MKSTFSQFCHQKEKHEHFHKKYPKTKDCGSCKKEVPEKAHKCCSNIANINFENEYYYKDYYQNNYYNSSFWSNQIYSLEIDPFNPLHIVQYFPFGIPEAYEDEYEEYTPYMNNYYSYQSELYDQYDYCQPMKKKEKEKKNENENEDEKTIDSEKEQGKEKPEFSPETVLDTSDIELKCIFKPKIKPKKAFKIKPKKTQKKTPKLNPKINSKINPKKKKNKLGKKKKGKKIEVEVFELKREMTEKKEEPKLSNEEEKFLEEFKKRILNGKYYLHY